jgi:integrase
MPLHCYPPTGRSPNIRIRGSVRGIAYDRSARTADPIAAEELRAREENRLLDRSIHGEPAEKVAVEDPTFAEAVIAYAKKADFSEGEGRFLKPLVLAFGSRRRSEFLAENGACGQAIVTAYVQIRHGVRTVTSKKGRVRTIGPDKPAAVMRSTISPMTAVLRNSKWPVALDRLEIKNSRLRFLTPVEAQRLVDAAAPHLRPLLIFMLNTGARVKEALFLEWRNVDLTTRRVVFEDTKNDESRGLPLNDAAFEALANLPGNREGAVFRTAPRIVKRKSMGRVIRTVVQGAAYAPREDNGGGELSSAFAGACVRAGFARWDGPSRKKADGRVFWLVDPFSPHTMRHTFGTWLIERGVHIRVAQELLGHKDIRMTMRYTHVNPDHLAPAVEGLGQPRLALPAALSSTAAPGFEVELMALLNKWRVGAGEEIGEGAGAVADSALQIKGGGRRSQ